MTKLEALSEKFRVLIKAVKNKPEGIRFFKEQEINYQEILRINNYRKVLINSAHTELRVWLRELLEKDERDYALKEFEIIDAKTEKKGRNQS